MTGAQEPPEVDEDVPLDVLRRRLYRADATEEDVQRYLAEVEAVPEEPAAQSAAAPRRRRPRLLPIGVAVAAVVALVAAVQLLRPAAVPAARSTPAPTVLTDVGEGQSLTVVGAAPRASAVPVSVAGTQVSGQQFEGRGNAVVALDAPNGAFDGGRATVAVTSLGTSPAAWRALLTVTRPDWTHYEVVMARGLTDRQRDSTSTGTFVYPKRPPTRVVVAADPDVRWTLVVGISGGTEPTLR